MTIVPCLTITFGPTVIIIFINITHLSPLLISLKEKWSEWIWGKNLHLRLSIDIRKDGEGGDQTLKMNYFFKRMHMLK